MTSPQQRIYDGNRAREVLENEAYIKAFSDLKAEITDKWQNSPSRDSQGRETLYLMLGLTNKLEGLLKDSLISGKQATLDLEHKRTLAERAKDWIPNFKSE